MRRLVGPLMAVLLGVLGCQLFMPLSDAMGGTPPGLSSGVPVNGEMTGGVPVDYTWSAVAGHHVTFAISNATMNGAAVLNVYNPNGSGACSTTFVTGQKPNCNFVASGTGVASAVIGPDAGSPNTTGTFTLTYAKDVTGKLKAGVPMKVSIKYPGQNADLKWSAVKGHHVTFAISNATMDGAAVLNIYNPNGSGECSTTFVTGQTPNCNFVASGTGVALAVIGDDPGSPNTTGEIYSHLRQGCHRKIESRDPDEGVHQVPGPKRSSEMVGGGRANCQLRDQQRNDEWSSRPQHLQSQRVGGMFNHLRDWPNPDLQLRPIRDRRGIGRHRRRCRLPQHHREIHPDLHPWIAAVLTRCQWVKV